jgi:ribosomal protein L13E
MTRPPRSIVIRHRKGMFKTRQGRGFSKAELREAGISSAEARRLKLNTDQKRHTKLDENLKALKTWLKDRKN